MCQQGCGFTNAESGETQTGKVFVLLGAGGGEVESYQT